MEQHRFETAGKRSGGFRRQGEDVHGVGVKQRCPSVLGYPIAQPAQSSAYGIKHTPAQQEGHDARQEERLDHRRLAGRQLTEPVVRFQLLEHQSDLPATDIELGQLSDAKRIGGRVGHVEPVARTVRVAHADKTSD